MNRWRVTIRSGHANENSTDYATNQKVLDRFFREGIERVKDTEDLITIGMRGDGDAPMGGKEGADHEYVNRDEYNMNLLKKVIKNQRKIIKDVTGRPADERPQPYIKRYNVFMTWGCAYRMM